ncbi:peptidase S33, tripeptidyl-peptidase [Pochonia chlamydosporia 170]|uniref:Peptidase S33, tripeptidyl-peptidase n=1 Tax=Pochonia chlamydosporia 170 TaxID=1380566 RepID=A0A179G3T2_METCM|nr:peptidase S33, tripeptidyl-peptidase [Pochonia chlamydosporia 170]OAQ72013.1 peptidase S33, tripeptidyl-peptidase [Pochonia chlamydosporia 170]
MISASVALRLLLPLSAITVAATDTQIRLQPIDTQVDIEGVATAASSQGKNSIIQWGKCNDSNLDNTIPVDCGYLELPLDYTDLESNSTLNLALLRVPAATQPAKGSIILNFGGPGVPGRESLASAGQLLQIGTGTTLPFRCLEGSYELGSFVSSQVLPDITQKDALGRLWARGTIDANICARRRNDTGRLLGTAFVARDVVEIAKSLGEDDMVRYWGFSYGTTLGATLVAMFPEKVDKVILDGVQNPHQYYHSQGDFEEWSQTDEVFSAIFVHCLNNPTECRLAKHYKTAEELENAIWKMIDTLKYHPVPMDRYIIDNTAVNALIQGALYATKYWQNLTTVLDMLLTNNIDKDVMMDALRNIRMPLDEDDLLPTTDAVFALLGIHCSERSVRAKTYDEFLPTLHRLYNTSRVIASASLPGCMTCAQWSMDAKERYEGDFRVHPKNPVLIIGNTYDAHTPIRSARNISSGFKDSVVLEVDGYGHSSLRLPSACTLEKISAYWSTGAMPLPNTVCQVDSPPFSNITWFDVIKNSTFGTLDTRIDRNLDNGLDKLRLFRR